MLLRDKYRKNCFNALVYVSMVLGLASINAIKRWYRSAVTMDVAVIAPGLLFGTISRLFIVKSPMCMCVCCVGYTLRFFFPVVNIYFRGVSWLWGVKIGSGWFVQELVAGLGKNLQ